jgi:hypothetical protein
MSFHKNAVKRSGTTMLKCLQDLLQDIYRVVLPAGSTARFRVKHPFMLTSMLPNAYTRASDFALLNPIKSSHPIQRGLSAFHINTGGLDTCPARPHVTARHRQESPKSRTNAAISTHLVTWSTCTMPRRSSLTPWVGRAPIRAHC